MRQPLISGHAFDPDFILNPSCQGNLRKVGVCGGLQLELGYEPGSPVCVDGGKRRKLGLEV